MTLPAAGSFPRSPAWFKVKVSFQVMVSQGHAHFKHQKDKSNFFPF